ncbi:MAG: phosphosulfolactate synthase [Gammaproteobacteria bacterium]
MSGKDKPMQLSEYLNLIGVPVLAPRVSPFDPGYDPQTLEGHLEQSAHLMSTMKISMACWQIADDKATRRKVEACRRHGIPACTGGGPFEVAACFGVLAEYLDLCAGIGMARIEAGEGFIDLTLPPGQVVKMAEERGLEVQFELGKKHGGTFSSDVIGGLIDQGRRWLDAGAKNIVVEARESAENIGVFGEHGELNPRAADRFAKAFGLEVAVFEAPNKTSQFALLNYFGPEVHLSNIRLEEVLRVEIYRRGLHSDAFQHANLRPRGPSA